MSKINFYFFIYFFFIIFIITPLNIFAFPFYNVQSAELSNGQKLLVHKLGIDIVDKDYNQKIRTEITFTDDEQISTEDKLKNVIIKKFENGYLICLIIDRTYIFDNLGNFLSEKENINFDFTVNYYSLNIKDNYHFFIGFISTRGFCLYYYEYKAATKEITLLSKLERLKIKETNFDAIITYSYQDIGINCHIMNDGENGDTLACIFMLYDDSDENNYHYYWYIKFFKVDGDNQIINENNPNYSDIQSEVTTTYVLSYFKAEVNSDKNILLICSYVTTSDDLCLFFDLKQKQFNDNLKYLGDIYQNEACIKNEYKLKLDFFQEKNQFLFSCVSSSNENEIIYVIFYFNNNNNDLLYNPKKMVNNDQCIIFNGYNFFYSNESDNYYIITDYICNKSLIETQEISEIIETDTVFECTLEKCETCDRISQSQNLCIKCNENKLYFPLKNSDSEGNKDCYNETTKPYNYFFNSIEKYYEPCYETCAKCEEAGNDINNNCLSCEFGFTFLPGDNNNCYTKCPYYFYYTIYGQYKCTKISSCPEDYYLLIKNKSQ